MRVFVTGGCGFIGSHQIVSLLQAGHEVSVLDDLSNSSILVLDRIEEITEQRPQFYENTVLDTNSVGAALTESKADAIIHFAGLKHVSESTSRTLDYYETNVAGLLSLLRAAEKAEVHKLVFSSSGSLYGETDQLPIVESHAHQPSNPYSASKSICERILSDLCNSDPKWSAVALRYFNPAGAHNSGLIGEDPTHLLSNLLPVLMHVAVGNKGSVSVCGADFDTPDGSGVRDYVHVEDVAEMHLRALQYMEDAPGFSAMNIGRGEGISVFEMIDAVERTTKKSIDRNIEPRRPGDVSALYADSRRAKEDLGSIEYKDLDRICADAWRWQSKNPQGYRSKSLV